MHDEREVIMELKHEPEPGYRTVFFLALSIALAYLGIIFIRG